MTKYKYISLFPIMGIRMMKWVKKLYNKAKSRASRGIKLNEYE